MNYEGVVGCCIKSVYLTPFFSFLYILVKYSLICICEHHIILYMPFFLPFSQLYIYWSQCFSILYCLDYYSSAGFVHCFLLCKPLQTLSHVLLYIAMLYATKREKANQTDLAKRQMKSTGGHPKHRLNVSTKSSCLFNLVLTLEWKSLIFKAQIFLREIFFLCGSILLLHF